MSGYVPLWCKSHYSFLEGASHAEELVEACAAVGCTLIGGETAELPGFYQGGEYDLAGFSVGIVDNADIPRI